jgi:hypothetical protein
MHSIKRNKMKTIIFLRCISAIFLFFLLTPIISAGADQKLSKEYLLNNEWGPNIGELGVFFKFKNNKTYKTEINFEGGEFYQGTYDVVNGKLALKLNESTEEPKLKGQTFSYTLMRDDNEIFFNEYLKLEGNVIYIDKIWNQKAIVKNGKKMKYQSTDVETINNLARIKDSSHYYQKPNEKSPRFMFSIWNDKTDKISAWSLAIPSDVLASVKREVQLILRTTKKDNKGRYWYCIVLPVGTGGYDRVRLENTSAEWTGSNIAWIKETEIKQIIQR